MRRRYDNSGGLRVSAAVASGFAKLHWHPDTTSDLRKVHVDGLCLYFHKFSKGSECKYSQRQRDKRQTCVGAHGPAKIWRHSGTIFLGRFFICCVGSGWELILELPRWKRGNTDKIIVTELNSTSCLSL